MRANKIMSYISILQVLGEPGCPFCRFLKDFQAATLQAPGNTEIHHLCNFHTWGLAAMQRAPFAAELFLTLLEEDPRASPKLPCDILRRNFSYRSVVFTTKGKHMLNAGKAVKVSIYLSEGSTHHGMSRYLSILDFLFFRGVSGATVLKGVAGFGADHHLHTSSLVDISDHLPLKIEFIETREKVDELLGKLEEMAGSGMIEVQETTIAKPAQVSQPKKAAPPAHVRIEGKAKMMRIYIGESDQWNDKPLYEGLVRAMRSHDLAGVTVYRGILGYGAHRRVHKDKPLHLSHDSSMMLSVVDTEEKLQNFLPIVDQMVSEGLVVLSDVDIVKYAHRAVELKDDQGEP